MAIEHSFHITTTPEHPALSPALVLYQGPPKVGKTHALCSWPHPLIINWEYNVQTLGRFPGIHVISPESPLQFEKEILPWILTGEMKKEFPEVETLGFDNITTWGRKLELEIRNGSNGKMEFDEWGQLLNRAQFVMSKFASICQQQGLNVVATAHEQEKSIQGPKNSVIVQSIDAAFPGSLRNSLPAYFDMILLPEITEFADKLPDGTYGPATTHYECRTRPGDRLRTAGGTLWGKGSSELPAKCDGTYQGLRKVCNLDES